MEQTLTPGRPNLILALTIGTILAFVPLTVLATGVDTNGLIEACRSIVGNFAGAIPCAGH